MLFPSSLVLGLLIGLPVLAHLTRQTPTDRVAFGAMLLVRRLVKRLRRRRRLKDPWILALRVLAVLLLTLASTAPQYSYQGEPPEIGGSGRVVVVLDLSMSMGQQDGGATLFQRARDEARERLRGMPEGVALGLVGFGEQPSVLTSELTLDRQRVIAQLEGLELTAERGNLSAALLEARRLLAGEPGEVLLWSDEAGPAMIPEAHEELTRLIELGSAVVPMPVHADPPRNVAVTSAVYGDGIEGGQVVLRVTNYGPDALEVPCEVELPDGASIPVFVDVPPEGEAEARVTIPIDAAGGIGEVHCEDPGLTADDRRYFHLPRVGASRVIVVDGDPGDTPTKSEVYFLERALAPWGAGRAGVLVDVVGPAGLSALDASRHRAVFLSNVGDPRPYAGVLTDFVRRGGSLVIAAGENVTAERYNAALGAVLPSPFRKSSSVADRGEDPLFLELPDTSLELFSPFRRGGRSTFGRVGSWRVMTLDPYAESAEVRTLLRYQGGVPALVEREIGRGRVVVWTSTIDLGWSNLPLQAVFMPMMQRLVTYLGGEAGGRSERVEAVVGAKVEATVEAGSSSVEVSHVDGEVVRSVVQGGTVSFVPRRPGGYVVRSEGGPPLVWVAANLDTAESDVRRTHSVAAAEARIDPELFTRYMPLSPILVAIALLSMLLSALWAMQEVRE
jgi:hypothetical protein